MNRDHARRRIQVAGDRPALVVAFPLTNGEHDHDESDDDADAFETPLSPFGPRNPYRIDDLDVSGLTERGRELKRATYIAHVRRAAKRRAFTPSLSPEQLSTVDGTHHRLLTPAAQAATELLTQARADRRDEARQGDPGAMQTEHIGINSTYRSADVQFRLWDRRYLKYLKRFQVEHGLALDEVEPTALARFIGGRTACPGYSSHQHGRAIDFATRYDGQSLRAGHRSAWRLAWLFHWLCDHAHDYGFVPFEPEPWHWTYEP